MESYPSVKNILLLDSDGKRVAVKYYADDWPTNASKLAFEKSVFTKTQKTNARTEGDFGYKKKNYVVWVANWISITNKDLSARQLTRSTVRLEGLMNVLNSGVHGDISLNCMVEAW